MAHFRFSDGGRSFFEARLTLMPNPTTGQRWGRLTQFSKHLLQATEVGREVVPKSYERN